MKRQTLFLIINALVMIVISVVLNLVVLPLIPQDPEDKLFGDILILSDQEIIEEIPEEGNFRIVHSRMNALDKNDNIIGVVYNVIARNSYTFDSDDDYGVIDLLVGIQNDKVYVEINDLRQTSTYVGGIQTYIYEVYDGILWTEVEAAEVRNVGDLEAGATASASTATVKELILKVVNLHYEVVDEIDPYEAMFEESLGYAYSEEDSAFVPSSELIVSKAIAYDEDDNVIGAIYKLVGSSVYYDEDPSPGSIALYVALAEDGTVLGYMMPEDTYNHTLRTNHYLKNEAFLDSIVGDVIDALDGNTDIISGATNTFNLISDLLDALMAEVTS
ncbi:MAG: hypothetical protein K9K93_01595 [Acholeplasmataceae bacterium]|nr:hypothetical protein [Acholeplasmataceae bacterium]